MPWEPSSSENRWGEGRVLEEVLWGLWPCFHDWVRVRKVKGRRQSTQTKDTACTKAPKHQRMHGWGHSERKSEGWEEVDWGRRVDGSGTTNILRVTLSSSIRGPWEAVGGFKSQGPSDLVLDRLLWLPCEEMDWMRAIPGMERPTFQGGRWGLTLAMAVGLQHQLGGRWRKRSQGWPPGFQAGGCIAGCVSHRGSKHGTSDQIPGEEWWMWHTPPMNGRATDMWHWSFPPGKFKDQCQILPFAKRWWSWAQLYLPWYSS